MIEGLPSTTLFNMIVYADGRAFELYPDMSPATPDNVQKAKDWLLPLNQVKGAQTKYGSRTLGPGGSRVEENFPFGRFKEALFAPRAWNEPVFEAMRQQADAVFLLTQSWGSFLYQDRDAMNEVRKKWNATSAGRRWAKAVEEGRKLLDEDNANRKAAGEPPRALDRNSERAVVRAYKKQMGVEDIQEPPNAETTTLGVKDFVDAFEEAYKTYAREAPALGIKKKNKVRFSLNVIYFKQEKFNDEKSQKYSDLHESEFTELAKAFAGECRSVAGLAAIKSYVDASSLKE